MHFKCAAKISGVRSRFNDTASYIDIRGGAEGRIFKFFYMCLSFFKILTGHLYFERLSRGGSW